MSTCESTISIVLTDSKNTVQCKVSPGILEATESLLLRNPRVVDGFGERTVSKVCHICGKDSLVLVAEICEIEFLSKDNQLKTLTVSGDDSYNLQDRIHCLSGGACTCPK